LRNSAIGVLGSVGVNLVGAVVLLVVLALVAGQVGTNLSTNTSAISNLDASDLVANLDDLSDNLVSYAERKRDVLSPSTGDGVNIGGANTAGVDRNVNVVLLELLERKLDHVSTTNCNRIEVSTNLLALEGAPVLDVSDGERVGGLWVRHCGVCVTEFGCIKSCEVVD
jgi:hypothetical protein